MKYVGPEAFREALESRLLKEFRDSGKPLDYLRKRVAFERFLARLFAEEHPEHPFVLKGAFALSLRVGARRTTKDLDLALNMATLDQEASQLIEQIRIAAERDLNDFFVFVVSQRASSTTQEPNAHRFTVEVTLAGRPFERFALDVVAEPLGPEAVEERRLPASVGFAGLRPPTVRAVHPTRQYADKLHAYTRPREHRSRVKDLVDLALLTIELEGEPNARERIRREVGQVFASYPTHEPWLDLPKPPASWQPAFAALAREVGLEPPDADSWFRVVNEFYLLLRQDERNNK